MPAFLISAGAPVVSYATTFTQLLSASSGAAGATVQLTVTPASGAWNGQAITPVISGLTAAVSPDSYTPTGTGAVVFTFTVTAGTGTLGCTASPTMASNGPQAYAIASNTATAYTMTEGTSAGVQGQTDTITFAPSPAGSTWPSGMQIVPASTLSGTFSPSTAVPTAGSSANITVGYVQSVPGAATISATNNKGLPNPANLSYTAASSGGTSGTMTAGAVGNVPGNYPIFQRDTNTGGAFGSYAPGLGVGAVSLSFSPVAPSTALYAKLYNADSVGATLTPGTGTQLTSGPVQIYGAVTAGSQTITVNFPFGPDWYYCDLSLDSSFSNPVRIQQMFGVGDLTSVSSASFISGFGLGYAYGSGDIPDLSVIVPYTKGSVYIGNSMTGGQDYGWQRQYGVEPSVDPGYYCQTTGAMEYCRLMAAQTGGLHGIVGHPHTGGGLDYLTAGTGVLDGYFQGTVGASGGKFKYFIMGINTADQSLANTARDFKAVADGLDVTYPAQPIIKCFVVGSGWFGSDGSWDTGYTRLTNFCRTQLESNSIVCCDLTSWNQFNGGHASMQSRLEYVRGIFRLLMSCGSAAQGQFGTTHRGPTLGGSATWSVVNNQIQIQIPFQHDGGSTLRARVWTETSQTTLSEGTAATPFQLANLFAVRLPGQQFGRGKLDVRNTSVPPYNPYNQRPGGPVIPLDPTLGVQIDNTNKKILLTLAGTYPALTWSDGDTLTANMSTGFGVQYGSDFNYGPSMGSSCCSLVDDNLDLPNVTYGHEMRAQLDIFVAPPTPATTALALNPVINVPPGAFLTLSGPAGTGVQASGVQVSIDNGVKATPFALKLYGNNSWDGLVPAPAGTGSHTIAIYPTGASQATATGTFTTATRQALLQSLGLSAGEAASLIFSFNASNYGTLWTDTARTQHVTAPMQGLQVWDDEAGNAGNRLTLSQPGARYQPSLDFSGLTGVNLSVHAPDYLGVNFTRSGRAPSVVNESLNDFNYNYFQSSSSAPMLAALNGDFTIISASSCDAYTPWIFTSGGNTSNPSGNNICGYGPSWFVRGSNNIQVTDPNVAFSYGGNTGAPYTVVLRYTTATDTLKINIMQAGQLLGPYTNVGTSPNTPLGLNAFAFNPAYGWGVNGVLAGFNSVLSDASTTLLMQGFVAPVWG